MKFLEGGGVVSVATNYSILVPMRWRRVAAVSECFNYYYFVVVVVRLSAHQHVYIISYIIYSFNKLWQNEPHVTRVSVVLWLSTALSEADDISLHLKPFRQQLDELELVEFQFIRQRLPSLMHVVCLIWSHSKYYCRPGRVVVLLQEICNILIDKVLLTYTPQMALNGVICAEAPLGNYTHSLTHSSTKSAVTQ